MDQQGLTARQEAWFASLREGLERDTGRTVAQWAEIARACPDAGHRARLAWFKREHGLGQNRASLILRAAFPAMAGGGSDADANDRLWADPAARAILHAIRETLAALADVTEGQRKTFTAFSRRVQFAAARPRGGSVLLGLALPPDTDPRLAPAGRHGWSERLLATLPLGSTDAARDAAALLEAAWARS